jgi:hypothetical protein
VKFPSGVEIAGGIALVAPLVISVSSTSMSTVNGHVVHYVHRDPIAIVGGIVAILCGLVAALWIRRSAPGRRGLRALAVVALVGLGVVHVLRGFGVIGGPGDEAGSMRSADLPTFQPPSHAPVTPPPIHDSAHAPEPVVRTFLDRWAKDDLDAIYRDADPRFRDASSKPSLVALLAELHDLAGAYVAPEGPVEVKVEDDARVTTGSVRFQRGVIDYKLRFTTGATPQLLAFNFSIPPSLRPAIHPEDAQRTAREVLDDLLGGKLDALARVTDPDLEVNLAKEDEQLHDFVGKLGRVEHVKLAGQHACDDDQCVDYEVVGTKGKAKATFTVSFALSHWQVDKLNLTPE